jgi:hypothetical protein
VGKSTIVQLNRDLSFKQTHDIPSKDLAVLGQIEYQEPRPVVTLSLSFQASGVMNLMLTKATTHQ